jgi:hypothetical protein
MFYVLFYLLFYMHDNCDVQVLFCGKDWHSAYEYTAEALSQDPGVEVSYSICLINPNSFLVVDVLQAHCRSRGSGYLGLRGILPQ